MKLVPPTNVPLGTWYANIYGESPSRSGWDVGPLGYCDGVLNVSRYAHEDIAKFVCAAPAMAEALVELYQFTYKHCQFVDADPILFKARSALLAAGYTVEAADQS